MNEQTEINFTREYIEQVNKHMRQCATDFHVWRIMDTITPVLHSYIRHHKIQGCYYRVTVEVIKEKEIE